MTYQIIITEETANVAVTSNSYPITIEYNATNLSANGAYGNSNVAAYLASNVSIPILTTANVQAAYFLGNGSQLTGLPATYGNANVAANLAAFGSNPISTTGNVTAGYVIGNGSLLTAITGANVTGTVANATFATSAATATTATSATSATTAGTVTTAAQANITSVGVLTSLSSTGNITGANINGNGSGLSSITGANVSGTVANATYATNAGIATFATTANAVAGANVSGTVANATFATSAATATTAGTVTTNAQPNITSVGTLTNLDVSGNAVIGGNLTVNGDTVYTNVTSFAVEDPVIEMGRGANDAPLTSNDGKDRGERLWYYSGSEKSAFAGYDNSAGKVILATDVSITSEVVTVNNFGNTQVGNLDAVNVVATTFTGSGAGLTSITGANVTGTVASATSAATAINVTDATQANITAVGTLTNLSVSGNTTSGNLLTGGLISAVGNVTSGNVLTANVLAGNISIASNLIRNINTPNASQTPTPDRIVLGNGYNGDYSAAYDPLVVTRGGLLHVMNRVAVANTQTNTAVRQFSTTQFADLSGHTYSSTGFRIAGGSMVNFVGNGTYTATGAQWASVQGGAQTLLVGNVGNVAMGNATVSHTIGAVNTSVAGAGGNIGNAIGTVSSVNIFSVTGNVTSGIAYATQLANSAASITTTPTTAIGYYHPGATNTYGSITGAPWRSATNYYAFKNDDDAAQVQLGSMRSYTEFNAVSGTTSGALTISKTAGQVQQINLTGNISGITYSNFVSSASDGTNTDEQSDTVTMIFNQGATGNFGVTFPTGAAYKYAGNVTTLQSVAANSVSLVSVSAIRIGGTTTYLTTISPGFV